MPNRTVRNAGGVPFLTLQGFFVVRQRQQPDGDTIAFAAAKRFSPGPVKCKVPVDSSGANTVNVRFQSIDAPEKTQPLGSASRNAALKHVGINPKDAGLDEDDTTADGPMIKVPGWLATDGIDGNERQLGYVFRKNPGFEHGEIISAAKMLTAIKQSTNYFMVSKGQAYPAFYENTDETHAAAFQHAADKARKHKAGVWSNDRTISGFTPTKDALGKKGSLVYPKFYRRVAKWTNAKASSSAFINWLKKQADGKKKVQGAGPAAVPLWTLFEPAGTKKVKVPYDVNKLWFSE